MAKPYGSQGGTNDRIQTPPTFKPRSLRSLGLDNTDSVWNTALQLRNRVLKMDTIILDDNPTCHVPKLLSN